MKKAIEVSPLEAHIGYWMRFVSNHVSHSFSKRLEAHDVTVAEWVIVRELLRSGETTPSTLAESVGLTRGAVSKLVERLISKGLINRTVSETDRRYQRIVLTRTGHALVPRLAALADQNDADFFGHLDARQRQALIDLLQDITRRHQLKNPPLN